MKTIVYNGIAPNPISGGGKTFEAGVPVECEDALADSLLNRSDFSEVSTQDAKPRKATAPEPTPEAETAPNTDAQGEQAN